MVNSGVLAPSPAPQYFPASMPAHAARGRAPISTARTHGEQMRGSSRCPPSVSRVFWFLFLFLFFYFVAANTRVQATWPITVPGCAQPAIHRTRCVAL